MTEIKLVPFARLLGTNSVLGMAQKVGLAPPPPPISVRNVVDLASRIILPLAPVGLQPQNGASGISNSPDLFFRDPGAGTPAEAGQFDFIVTQNDVIVDPNHMLTGAAATAAPVTSPGLKWFFPLPPGQVTLSVSGRNRAGNGPSSSSTFTVSSPPPRPPQTGTLTLEVTLTLPAFSQRFTVVGWSISGPGAPQAPISSPVGDRTSSVSVPLPAPHGSASYTIRSSVKFAYDGLVRNNGTSGPEDSPQVDLSQPTLIPWTGQSRVARFAVTYDSFNNVFLMASGGLFG